MLDCGYMDTVVQSVMCTLVFPMKDGQVLLGLGKKGYNTGIWNGYGGKVDPDDVSVRRAAVRELQEEVGLEARETDLRYHGYMTFYWESEVPGLGVQTAREVTVHMYSVFRWSGVPRESDAMATPMWFPVAHIPYDRMCPDNPEWLPLLLENKLFIGSARYNSLREVVDCQAQVLEYVAEPSR